MVGDLCPFPLFGVGSLDRERMGSASSIMEDPEPTLALPRTTSADEKDRGTNQEDDSEVLIPGLPDAITLDEVATKLPWNAFHILSAVSRAWRRAILSRQVYDARLRTSSSQTLAIFSHIYRSPRVEPGKERNSLRCVDIKFVVSMYSLEENWCFHLPPIPGVKRGIPMDCGCVCLDGKIYILGGVVESGKFMMYLDEGRERPREVAEVYVLDLASLQWQWKQCASMSRTRANFGCSIAGGKIYVFGGRSYGCNTLAEAEVYDSAKDSWSPIQRMLSSRAGPYVATVGDEICMYNGWVLNSTLRSISLGQVRSVEVYNPSKDQWRTVKDFRNGWSEAELNKHGFPQTNLLMHGKLHKMGCDGIQVYDMLSNMWRPSHSFSFRELEASLSMKHVQHHVKIVPQDAVELNGELLVLVRWEAIDMRWDALDEEFTAHKMGIIFLRSQGLGCEKKEIVWHEILRCPLTGDRVTMMSSVEL